MAVYTEGSTKIFRCDVPGTKIENVFDMAEKARYRALCFNGEVYILQNINCGWVKTPFLISDFRAS